MHDAVAILWKQRDALANAAMGIETDADRREWVDFVNCWTHEMDARQRAALLILATPDAKNPLLVFGMIRGAIIGSPIDLMVAGDRRVMPHAGPPALSIKHLPWNRDPEKHPPLWLLVDGGSEFREAILHFVEAYDGPPVRGTFIRPILEYSYSPGDPRMASIIRIMDIQAGDEEWLPPGDWMGSSAPVEQ